MKKKFNVKIMGQDISIASDRGDEYVAQVVRLVNDRAEQYVKSGSSTTLKLAILVSLNLADELLSVKREREQIYDQLESKSESLINFIDRRI